MACAYPSYNPNIVDLDGSLIPIPCNKCFNCRLDYQKRAVDRMFCAYHSWSTSAFVTFTYDDEHLVYKDGFINPTLSKEDLHRYIDKIRHQIPFKFDYYICGEYGDKFNRPHYHAIFFGLDYELHKSFFENSWKLGSVKVLPVSQSCFKYVSKYITKSCSSSDSEYYDYGLIPPFRKMSRGLGLSVYKEHINEIYRYGYFVFHDRKIFVNRYYFNKMLKFDKTLLLNIDLQKSDRYALDRENATRSGFESVDVYKYTNTMVRESQLESQSIRKTSKSY